MPKRRRSDDGCEAGIAANRRRRRRRHHLYLVMDDWRWGYSIRKVDLSSTDSDSDEHTERRLPPAVVRVEAPRGEPKSFTSGPGGTTIMAMYSPDKKDVHPLVPARHVTAFDVRTRAVAYGPRPRSATTGPAQNLYLPVGGDRVFALGGTSFEKLGGDWAWRKLQMPSFDPRGVTACVAHPDGNTIFFSVGAGWDRGRAAATFTYDDAAEEADDGGAGQFRWTRHGEWALPFDGAAHYDRALDAWVGLASEPGAFGHVCACDVVAPDGTASRPYRDDEDEDEYSQVGPARKVSKENLLVREEEPSERHVSATLVPMGGGGRYCLVQCIAIELEYEKSYYEQEDLEYDSDDDGREPCRRLLYRLTTFSLKYDKNGDLTTGDSSRVRYYTVPQDYAIMANPVAFWM